MSAFAGLYDIREMKETDKNFIYATFLQGLYYGDSWFSATDKASFMRNYKGVIETLLASPKVSVFIACDKQDTDVILGYSILSADAQKIHWVHVKDKWRKHGIAKSLLPKYPVAVTHLTKIGKVLITKFETNVIFDPFSL